MTSSLGGRTFILRQLRKLLDEVAPGLADDVMQHLGDLWDALGFFGPVLATAMVAALAIGAMMLQRRWRRFRLPEFSADGARDVAAEPTLSIQPRLSGINRIFRSRNRVLSIRMDAAGIVVERRRTTSSIAWSDVTQWRRHGLARWTLRGADTEVEIKLDQDHGLRAEDLKRIDTRLCFHVTDRPELTWRRQLHDARLTIPTRLSKLRTAIRSPLIRAGRPIRRMLSRPQKQL